MGLCFLKLVTVAAEVTVGVVLIHLWAHEPPNGILSGSAIFAGLAVVTKIQTDTQIRGQTTPLRP